MCSSPRILIIDDDPDDCDLARYEISRGLGRCRVTTASTQRELASAFETGSFDVVVTDYNLGWTDGIKVFGMAQRTWPDAPVIMFTGADGDEIAVAALKAGLSDCIHKSTRPRGRLVAAVQSALGTASVRPTATQLHCRTLPA